MLLLDVPDALQRVLFEGSESLPATYVADSFLNRTCYLGADVRGWYDISTLRSGAAQAAGLADSLQLNVVEPDGKGCWLGSPQSRHIPIPEDLHLTLTRLARHLAAAHRLRRKYPEASVSPDAAEAVLSQGGSFQHATGVAQEPANRAALARAARAMDSVRSRRKGADPREAIKEWRSVVAKRWTFLEHFESDGKRFLLAMDNRAKPPSIELLSAREREVVLQALRGQDNKAIANALGLAHSTVRVLLARAAAKASVRTRRALLEKMGMENTKNRVDADGRRAPDSSDARR
jgi:DNA-binding CsgD family transcriptional regulator